MYNEDARQNWGDGAVGWVENEAVFDAVFAPVAAAILGAAELGPDHRMLDIGCGTGTLLAAATGAGASATGIDISPGMVDAARRRVPDATVVVGDAQSADLGADFDRVVSRFGVMFFDDPVAAFTNIRRSCAPDARMVFACWRRKDENPMFTLGTSVLEARLDPAPVPPAPGAPGPTAYADRDQLLSLLSRAGWGNVTIDPLDFEIDYGFRGGDGVEERVATLLATTSGRRARAELEPRLGSAGWADLLDDVRAELRSHQVDGVVRFPAATWLVTATNAPT